MQENEKDLLVFYPSLYKHLLSHKKSLSNRNKDETNIRYEWYCLQRWGANYWSEFYRQKIAYPETSQGVYFSLDNHKYFLEKTSFMILSDKTDLRFIIAFLNSKLATFYFKEFCGGCILGEKGFQYNKHALEKVVLPNVAEAQQEKFIKIVDEILENKANKQDTQALEDKLDTMIYELYGLSDEEISIIKKQVDDKAKLWNNLSFMEERR